MAADSGEYLLQELGYRRSANFGCLKTIQNSHLITNDERNFFRGDLLSAYPNEIFDKKSLIGSVFRALLPF